MFNLKSIVKSAVVSAIALSFGTTAFAGGHSKVLRIQSVLPTTGDEIKMVKEFGKDVAALTGGSLTLEVLPAGAIVGSRDVMDAVDAGLVEGGFAWTHYWGGKHVAANLFGAPIAGAGVGIDNLAFLSWFQYGGGKELYDRLWDEMGVNVKGFMFSLLALRLWVGSQSQLHPWTTFESTVSVRLQVWWDKRTKILVWHL